MDDKIKVNIPEEVRGLVIGRKHCNLNRIQAQTGAKIEVIDREIYVSGGQQERTRAIRHLKSIYMNRTENFERKIKVGIPEEVMGFVIGKRRHNLNRIQEETGAKIDIINGEICVSGGQQECRYAINLLKTSACEGMHSSFAKKQCDRYDFVDGSGRACEFRLHLLNECPKQDWDQNKQYFRIERIDEEDETLNGEIEIGDLENIVQNVLQKIQTKDDSDGGEMPKANFWCHFGQIYITGNVDEADESETYPLADFQKQFNKKNGWKMVFNSAIKNMKIKDLEEALVQSESRAIPSHIRYDLYFLTPTCSRIRAKFFVDFNGKPLNHLDFVSQFIDVKGDPSSSTSQYVFCESFIHRGKISIAIPSLAMDVRILIRTVSPSRDMKEKEYEETLKKYLDKIVFTDEGQIKLPDDTEMPDDFVLQFCRKCNRRFYTHTETEEDSFTIIISEEEERNELNVEEVKKVKTDVHLYGDQCNGLLRSEDWEPEQIVSKLPTFLSALRGIQANISNSGED